MIRFIAVFLMLLPTNVLAASAEETVLELFAEHRAECVAEQASFSNDDTDKGQPTVVELNLPEGSLYQMKISAAGKLATVLFANFSCTNIDAGYWCGSSGCKIYVIVDGARFQAHGWKPFSMAVKGEVVVMIPKSGGACNQSNATPCYSIAIWNNYTESFDSTDNVFEFEDKYRP